MKNINKPILRRLLLKSSAIAIPGFLVKDQLIANANTNESRNSTDPENPIERSEKKTIELSDSPIEAEIDLKMASIHNQFGNVINNEQAGIVRNKVSAVVQVSGTLRKQNLDDFDGPWSVFHPVRLQTAKTVETHQDKSAPLVTAKKILDQTSPADDIAFATIFQLASGLRSGKFTAIRLTEYFLNRLETFGPKLNCIASLTKDLAMKQARAADARIKAGKPIGILDGIPFGAKDLLSVAGYPTSNGCAPYVQRVLNLNATVINKLTSSGGVLVAKLAMVECAGGLGYRQPDASAFGPGLTPYDTKRWSGGSSSGSASAVAAGLVPFAIGSETWGSITTPSSYCGLSGLRPTYGRVSRAGAFALSYSLDKIGPLARTASEADIILRTMSGIDSEDPSSTQIPWYGEELPDNHRFKIAIIKEGLAMAQPEVRENFHRAVEVFRGTSDIEEIEVPTGPYADVLLTILGAESASALEELVTSGLVQQMKAPEDRIGGYANRTILAMDYIRALRLRGQLCRSFDEYISRYDAILTVPTSATAPPISQYFGSQYSHKSLGGPGNLSGSPALVMPSGLDKSGLPTAIQLDSRVGNEAVLVKLGHYFQSQTKWHEQKPDLSKI